MKKVILSTLIILLTLQPLIYAKGENGNSPVNNQMEISHLLTEHEKVQLEYEKRYLDIIFDITEKYFNDTEGFNQYGEIYIDNEKEFKFVIAVAKTNKKVDSFINEIKGEIPENLLSIQKIQYSKNDLIAIQQDILNKLRKGNPVISRENVGISSSVKEQKVILTVEQNEESLNSEYSASSLFPEYKELLKIQKGGASKPAKLRTDTFTEIGGGINITTGSSCSTAAIATKESF